VVEISLDKAIRLFSSDSTLEGGREFVDERVVFLALVVKHEIF